MVREDKVTGVNSKKMIDSDAEQEDLNFQAEMNREEIEVAKVFKDKIAILDVIEATEITNQARLFLKT